MKGRQVKGEVGCSWGIGAVQKVEGKHGRVDGGDWIVGSGRKVEIVEGWDRVKSWSKVGWEIHTIVVGNQIHLSGSHDYISLRTLPTQRLSEHGRIRGIGMSSVTTIVEGGVDSEVEVDVSSMTAIVEGGVKVDVGGGSRRVNYVSASFIEERGGQRQDRENGSRDGSRTQVGPTSVDGGMERNEALVGQKGIWQIRRDRCRG